MLNRRHAGWTLLETLFVLGIACALGLLWIPKVNKTSYLQEENQFIQDFHSQWLMALATVVAHKDSQAVVFNQVHGAVPEKFYFRLRTGAGKYTTLSILVLPRTMKLTWQMKVTIYPHGVVTPKKISIVGQHHRVITFIPQMGWGLYRVEINENPTA